MLRLLSSRAFSSSAAARAPKKLWALQYDVVDDMLERRKPFRAEHLDLATQYADSGDLILGGALLEPTDQSLLVFRAETPESAKEFARTDPYVLNGLVRKWQVREWAVVLGAAAGEWGPES